MEAHLQNIRVHYQVYGSGKPVLMIHGFSLDHRSMVGCMEPIFEQMQGWKRIYVDLPGMGKTKGEEWIQSSDDMLEVLLQFIHHVIGDEPFLVVGESYGGYLARGILHKKQDQIDGMMLTCPAIVADASKRELPPHTVMMKDEQVLSSLSEEDRAVFTKFSVVQDQTNWERFRDQVLAGSKLADLRFLSRLKRQYAFSFLVDELSKPYEKPVLILVGRQDSIAGYRDAWQLIENYPRGTFAVLDRAGHNLSIEQEGLLQNLASEWLERVREERSSS